MPYKREEITLPSIAPGVTQKLLTYRFGDESTGKSAYIQAGLHGDEHPGLLVIQHLMGILEKLDNAGEITGHITVTPFANPIGMSQRLFGPIVGRFDCENGENFNRNFPSLASAVESDIYSNNENKSLKEWKVFFQTRLEQLNPRTAASAMKLQLAKLAMQHDIVLDLHCETESISHIYSSQCQQERALLLAEDMGVKVIFVEKLDAGGGAFDQVHSGAWGTLQQKGKITASDAGFSATIELRGQADVSDELAHKDAVGIVGFLRREGIISGSNQIISNITSPKIYPLEGASHIPSPCSGIIVYRKELGDTVQQGELIAEVVKLDGGKINERLPVISDTEGVIVARQQQRLIRPGQRAALVAGTSTLSNRVSGKLLLDF